MAAYLTFLALFTAVFLVAAEASIYRTTEIGSSEERCGEEIEQQELSHCMQFLEECGYGECKGRRSEHLDPCCNQLKSIQTPCRCKAIEEMMQQGGMRRQQQSPEMMEAARNLPAYCGIPPLRCSISTRGNWY